MYSAGLNIFKGLFFLSPEIFSRQDFLILLQEMHRALTHFFIFISVQNNDRNRHSKTVIITCYTGTGHFNNIVWEFPYFPNVWRARHMASSYVPRGWTWQAYVHGKHLKYHVTHWVRPMCADCASLKNVKALKDSGLTACPNPRSRGYSNRNNSH